MLRHGQQVRLLGILISLKREEDHAMRWSMYNDEYEFEERRIVEQFPEMDDVVLEAGTGLGLIAAICAKKSDQIVSIPWRLIVRWNRV